MPLPELDTLLRDHAETLEVETPPVTFDELHGPRTVQLSSGSRWRRGPLVGVAVALATAVLVLVAAAAILYPLRSDDTDRPADPQLSEEPEVEIEPAPAFIPESDVTPDWGKLNRVTLRPAYFL